MEKKTKKWRSPSLGKDMELRVYGSSGTPVLAIPTRGKGCDQWERKGMVDHISFQLENGFNQLFCIESDDQESFFNDKIDPEKKILRHRQYESYIIEEIVPYIKDNNPVGFLIVVGVDMGGYHAINLGLKHSSEFGKVIGLSGVYDIRQFMNGYYDDNVYYNNPVDYMPMLNNDTILNRIRKVDFRIVSFQNDLRKDDAYRLADILRAKLIDFELDVWEMNANEEWEVWRQMLKVHIV